MAVKIALAQVEVSPGQPSENLSRARGALEQAKASGAELVVLPELWLTGYVLNRANEYSSKLTTGFFQEIASMANEFSLYVCGSNIEEKQGQFFNTQTLHSPEGELLASYRKTHLFGLMNEPAFLKSGDNLVVTELPWGRTGMAICYDLRFPEVFRSYAFDGAELVLLSAEWPNPRLEHWRVLLRARAIENQSFVVACNCVGENEENVFFGHSMIIDPWGQVIVEAQDFPTTITAEIDLELVIETRRRYPFLADRRENLKVTSGI